MYSFNSDNRHHSNDAPTDRFIILVDPSRLTNNVADPDPGSRIPNLYFWELCDNFLGNKFYKFFKLAKFFSSTLKKWNNLQFCEICGYIKRYDKIFFSPLSFVPVFGFRIREPRSVIRNPRSGIRDTGYGMGKNQDPGSGINIPDPQHCSQIPTSLSNAHSC